MSPAPIASPVVPAVILAVVLGLAALFKPWQTLRHKPLQNPWFGALLILPCVWWTAHLLPVGMDTMALHISGACLLVLMFGWPLAMWTLVPVALGSQLIEVRAWPDPSQFSDLFAGQLTALADEIVWRGMLPGTLALLLGLAVRRFLPKHLFVYILGRGFIVTALAISLSGYLAYLAGHKPDTLALDEWMLAHWLLGWGEAISTGMLTAIFVAFKPHWLLTYSDSRYLPGTRPKV